MTRNKFSLYQFKLVALSLGLLVSLMGSVKLYSAEAAKMAKPELNELKAGGLFLHTGALDRTGDILASAKIVLETYEAAKALNEIEKVTTSDYFNTVYNTMAELALMANWAQKYVFTNDSFLDFNSDETNAAIAALSGMIEDGLLISAQVYNDNRVTPSTDHTGPSTIPWFNNVAAAGNAKGYNLPNASGAGGYPRALAANYNDLDLAAILAAHGALLAAPDEKAEEVPSEEAKRGGADLVDDLITAVSAHDAGGIRALVAGDVDVDAKNNAGDNALHVATRALDKDIVALLLDLGASKTIKNAQGVTPEQMIKSNVTNRKKYGIVDSRGRAIVDQNLTDPVWRLVKTS